MPNIDVNINRNLKPLATPFCPDVLTNRLVFRALPRTAHRFLASVRLAYEIQQIPRVTYLRNKPL
jgi:hypothetical protein